MAAFKKVWDILRQINSCWLGVIVTGTFIFSGVLLAMFPPHPGAFLPPGWFLLTFFGLGLLAPVGLVLAIRDFLVGERLLALLGVGLSCWPGALLLAFFVSG